MNKKLVCILLATTVFIFLAILSWAATVPKEAQRHFHRGLAAVEVAKTPEDYEQAIEEFRKAQALAPDWPDPYYNLAILQEKTGKLKEAVASFKQYLRLAPNAPDAAKIQEQIYKLEYKAEQVLSVPEIIDVLVSFLDGQKWQQDGTCMQMWSIDFFRAGDDVVKVLTNEQRGASKSNSYEILKVTGPVVKYIKTLNVCSADADRDLGGCDIITENEIDVVSKTLVKINEKVIRGGPLGSSLRPGDKKSCKYQKK
jgi:tetratricopeptide (TPR) repeat protein